jgi:hypothetical protein
LPYSDKQIIANAVRILIQSNLFPLKEFDTWEAITLKSYPALKMFIHTAYGRRLTAMALQSMSGQNGYANQTIYNVFADGVNRETGDNTVTTITQTAALTAESGGTGHTISAGVSAEVAKAINQLSANQSALMAQMATLSFGATPPLVQQTRAFVPNVPPIQQIAVPVQHPRTGFFI